MSRQAPFDLPYSMSGMYCTGAIGQLEHDQMIGEFPRELIHRIDQGSGVFGTGCEITQDDIDGLSDTAWEYLRSKLG